MFCLVRLCFYCITRQGHQFCETYFMCNFLTPIHHLPSKGILLEMSSLMCRLMCMILRGDYLILVSIKNQLLVQFHNVYPSIHPCTNIHVTYCMCVYVCMYVCVWMEGWMDGFGWMDGWTVNGWIGPSLEI